MIRKKALPLWFLKRLEHGTIFPFLCKVIRNLLVFSESSPEIGLGHLVECKSIVDLWSEKHGLESWFFYVNGDFGSEEYFKSRNVPHINVDSGYLPPAEIVGKFDTILVNMKYVEYGFLRNLRKYGKRMIVVDELGGREITADFLVNFSINPGRHQYGFPEGRPVVLFGPEYFPPGKALLNALCIPRPQDSGTVVVSMGGYDNSRITNKVLMALNDFPSLRKEVILGPGFERNSEFDALIMSLGDSYSCHSNVNDLPQRIRGAQFLVNSGGNTLYEAGILGTPVLVIGEVPHEIDNGDFFEKMGIALNMPKGRDSTQEEIVAGIRKIADFQIAKSAIITLRSWYEAIV